MLQLTSATHVQCHPQTNQNFLTTDNNLFSSSIDSDSMKSRENGSPATKTHAISKQVPIGAASSSSGGGGGLFDDDDDDDDFFIGKSLKKSDPGMCVCIGASVLWSKFRRDPHSQTTMCVFLSTFTAAKEKSKPKKAIDLFDEDDEDGDIFSEKYSAPTPTQNKKVEEQVKPPEKKVNINIEVEQ